MAKAKTKVAAGAMSAGSAGVMRPGLTGKMIEDAMSQAVLDAHAKGIMDDGKILKLKLAARDRVVEQHRKDEAEAAKAASRGK